MCAAVEEKMTCYSSSNGGVAHKQAAFWRDKNNDGGTMAAVVKVSMKMEVVMVHKCKAGRGPCLGCFPTTKTKPALARCMG